jgi:hypothetical protein
VAYTSKSMFFVESSAKGNFQEQASGSYNQISHHFITILQEITIRNHQISP